MAFNLNIFKTLDQVKSLEVEKADLLKRLEVAEKDLTEAQDVIGNFMVKQKEFDTTIEATQKEYQAKIDALEVQLASTKNGVNKEAAQVLASLGVEPEVIPVSAMDTKGNVMDEFNKLKGPEQTAFYLANKEVILKASGLIK